MSLGFEPNGEGSVLTNDICYYILVTFTTPRQRISLQLIKYLQPKLSNTSTQACTFYFCYGKSNISASYREQCMYDSLSTEYRE